jgi:hypothetical protein
MSNEGRGEMTSTASGKPAGGERLRAAALIAVLAGALGSLGFELYAGRRNDSVVLRVLMASWVLSPFLVLLLASVASRGWSALTRQALDSVMIVVTVGSLAIYGADAVWPRKQAAFVYVVVPPILWLLMATVVSIAAVVSARLSRRG